MTTALPLRLLRTTVGLRRPFFGSCSRGGFSSTGQSSVGWEKAILSKEVDCFKSWSPKLNEPMTQVLKGLACSTAEVLGDDASSGVRAIRLGNNATFLLGVLAGDTIYERRFYPRLANVICSSSRRVVLLSNPGTGKSVFQFYMLARFLNPALFAGDGGQGPTPYGARTFGFAVPPKVVVRQVLGDTIQVWFLEQQVVYNITEKTIGAVLRCFDPATMVYFFEPMKVKGVEPFANDDEFNLSTLATVSPDISRYHEFKKVATRKYMPLFTENELLAIGRDMRARPDFDATLKALYEDDAIRNRFKRYNGIIRHVLPLDAVAVSDLESDREVAVESTNAAQFLTGDLAAQTLSHYVAVFKVDESDFSKAGLAVVNAEVREDIVSRFQKLAVTEQMKVLQQYIGMKHKPTDDIPSALYENVVAYHLTSEKGVKWNARIVNVRPGEEETVEGPTPLHLQLSALVKGEVPKYAAMEPYVLYKSARRNFPMCDLVYKDEEGKLVCIQVSLEQKGARTVGVGAFQAFCEHMGWEAPLSEDQRRLISFVYCPNPKFVDKARVKFSYGVDLRSYTVWLVNEDFGSGYPVHRNLQ